MRNIQLRDAKANLSSLVNDVQGGEAALITRHGKPQAVILSFDAWQKLSSVPSFGRLLMAAPLKAGDLPERNQDLGRTVDF